jgi:hypothetical protein
MPFTISVYAFNGRTIKKAGRELLLPGLDSRFYVPKLN